MPADEGGPGDNHVIFGHSHHTACGRSSGEHATFKYTNASASTPNILIICDGGSRDQNTLPQACVQAIASTAGQKEAEQSLGELLRISLLHKQLSSHNCISADASTRLVLQLSPNLENGCAVIESFQIGSTRWALLSWDENGHKFTCEHLSPDDYGSLTSRGLRSYFNHGECVRRHHNVTVGSLILAGTER